MAQQDFGDGGQKPLSQDEKKRAVLFLVLGVLAIDAILIAAYFYVVLVLGYDPVLAMILLVGVSMATGLYFAWRRQRIERGS
ncbi:MAG: hypothetical protein CVV32_00270 [Methanomicrobiales archaeon HGW-Methanomicrobiales-3]|jgi:hypothetical protein|nr:MAG: hypothetical protein CVV32_00270 [Methanomicrobiales archaeon HGW-Methanomicrobiales-3]